LRGWKISNSTLESCFVCLTISSSIFPLFYHSKKESQVKENGTTETTKQKSKNPPEETKVKWGEEEFEEGSQFSFFCISIIR
jgi:hypothetical protein